MEIENLLEVLDEAGLKTVFNELKAYLDEEIEPIKKDMKDIKAGMGDLSGEVTLLYSTNLYKTSIAGSSYNCTIVPITDTYYNREDSIKSMVYKQSLQNWYKSGGLSYTFMIKLVLASTDKNSFDNVNLQLEDNDKFDNPEWFTEYSLEKSSQVILDTPDIDGFYTCVKEYTVNISYNMPSDNSVKINGHSCWYETGYKDDAVIVTVEGVPTLSRIVIPFYNV